MGISQNWGTILGVPIIRTIVYWGPLFLGNYMDIRLWIAFWGPPYKKDYSILGSPDFPSAASRESLCLPKVTEVFYGIKA